jgi:hypothetical protein
VSRLVFPSEVLEILRDAEAGVNFSGDGIHSEEALDWCVEHNLIEKYYDGLGGFLGLSKFRLSKTPVQK